MDIPAGLEEKIPPGIRRDTEVMIAAQYILLAGDVLDEELVKKPAREGKSNEYFVNKWRLWVGSLKELAEKELAPHVKLAVVEARKKLVSLHPELFSVSEGGSIEDV